jgi:hypothetical protein
MALGKLGRGLVALALLAGSPGLAQAAGPEAFTVDDLVHRMADLLTSAKSISVHVEKTFDDVLVTGPKLTYAGAMDLEVRRPDRFYISYGDDLGAKEVWYNGKHLVVLDTRANVYGELPSADTIDATLQAVKDKYDLKMPLAALFSSDLYQRFTDNVDDTMYVGVHDVNGTLAHHVWFKGETTHYQLWIDAGDRPLPLKLVVTYVGDPGEPSTTYVFSDWNLNADLPDDDFEPDIPKTAALAAFLPRKGE